MTNFKLSKKNALTDTRTNIYDLHEKKLDYFEFKNKDSSSWVDNEEIEYLLDFVSIINKNKNNEVIIENGKNMDSFVTSKLNTTKTELYNEYIRKFNPDLKPIMLPTNNNHCTNCNSDSFIYETKTGSEICTICGLANYIINHVDYNVLYTETSEQLNIFNYKRNNHFQECLNQLQAKENTTIPTKIIDDLTREFKKYNITDPKLFTPGLVKEYLKKLKYNKYYEHIPTIINDFCGINAPKMTQEFEQQLKIMFDEIQVPFEKYSKIVCPLRKNFLNYNYILYKMCELLNKDEFLHCFPLLKSREKLYEHDLIWKGICRDLLWEYIPSI